MTDEQRRVSQVRLAELGVLAATLVHELRQPVFAIKALAQLTRAELDDGHADRLDQLLGQVEHVEALLELYGAFGSRRGQVLPVDLNRQVERAIEMLAHRRAEVGAALDVQLCEGPAVVSGREVALRQVAVNLFQNALDAVAGQDVRAIRVYTEQHGDRVTLTVRDSGPGLAEAVRESLFDPFVTTKPKGTGLGLYIAWKLVQEAKGTLEVGDDEGGGTLALVSLPAA